MSKSRVGSLLDKIPGYGGYRDKERRRESDRRIREQLALEYGQLADRLGRIATRLAEDRQIAAIRYVDRPHDELKTFIDRVRTATYGYAGLFSDNPVDEQALDQIAAFDQALDDQIEVLDEQISALEAADPASPDFRTRSEAISQTVQGLRDRFDRRREVIDSGTALAPAAVAGMLASSKEAAEPPTAYNLHEGEAVSRGGRNYTIIGRVSIQTPTGSWRDFQLDGGTEQVYLRVPATPGGELHWLRAVTFDGRAGAPEVSVGGTPYQLADQARGTGEVIGKSGASGQRPVRYLRYASAATGGVLHVYDWGADTLALAGEPVDPLELEIYSREGNRAV
jgi:hypothetical protein